MEILKAVHLKKDYRTNQNEVHALNDVSFSVKRGSLLPLLERVGVERAHYYICLVD